MGAAAPKRRLTSRNHAVPSVFGVSIWRDGCTWRLTTKTRGSRDENSHTERIIITWRAYLGSYGEVLFIRVRCQG